MEYRCAGYDRLSDADDEKTDESSSIQSQKMIINSFAKFNNLTIYKHYVDDGYSGGNFDRPAFKEMIKDIEQGKINCVITKDLSRLGREMYKTGEYIEDYFLEKGIRYIAINDSYDSNVGDSMLGVRLSVNDLYLRDVSKKVKSAFKAKQEKGDYIGSIALYGYKKDPEDRHHLIVDEEVKDNVLMIYDLALSGIGVAKIAEILTRKKIPIPIVYKQENRAKNVTENDGYGIWKRQTVKSMLTNEMYVGNMVQNTYNKVSYRTKKLRKTRKEEIIVVPNTHEAIIDRNTFDKVQEILKNRFQEKKSSHQLEYLLGGMLYCKDCGRTIRISKKIQKKGVRHYTQCNLYTRKGKFGVCSSHALNYDLLEEDVIEYLRNICENFCEKYDFDEITDNSKNVINKNLEKLDKKIIKCKDILQIHQNTLDELYIDKTKGIVDIDMYKRIYDKTYSEQEKIKKELIELEKMKKENEKVLDGNNSNFKRCQHFAIDYMSLKKPTKEMIKRLVDRIEIDKDKKVYVYLRFPYLVENR